MAQCHQQYPVTHAPCHGHATRWGTFSSTQSGCRYHYTRVRGEDMRMNRKAALAAGASLGVAFVGRVRTRRPRRQRFAGGTEGELRWSLATLRPSTPVAGEFRVCKAGNTCRHVHRYCNGTAGDRAQGSDYTRPFRLSRFPPGVRGASPRTTAVRIWLGRHRHRERTTPNLTGIAGARVSTVTGISTIRQPGESRLRDFINSIHGVRLDVHEQRRRPRAARSRRAITRTTRRYVAADP